MFKRPQLWSHESMEKGEIRMAVAVAVLHGHESLGSKSTRMGFGAPIAVSLGTHRITALSCMENPRSWLGREDLNDRLIAKFIWLLEERLNNPKKKNLWISTRT